MKQRNILSRLAERLWRDPTRRMRMLLVRAHKGRGEVDGESEMGKCLRALAHSPQFICYVEIGTATGLGSTLALMEGILPREDNAALWSVECVPLLHDIAQKNWRGRDTGGRLHLIHGSVVRTDEIMSPQEAQAHPLCTGAGGKEVRGFVTRSYPKNCEAVAAAPDALPLIPDAIDVLLLDGGEFSSHAEFAKLHSRARVIVLDDSHRAIKNYHVREELQRNAKWQMIVERPDERNGWCIFCRSEAEDIVRNALAAVA